MRKTVAILTSEPLTTPGGVEHVVRELVKGLELRGYDVLVFHRDNAAPRWLRRSKGRLARGLGDFLLSWYLGRRLRDFSNGGLAAVITNGPVGWSVPNFIGASPKKVHIYHGTYRGQAEAIRPFITWKGYLKLKWWDSMVLERACGAGKHILCNSDQTRKEVQRFFGRRGVTTWVPLDTSHFRPLVQSQCRGRLGLPEDGLVGLFVGSTQPTKGWPTVLKLIRSFPGERWLLALRGIVPSESTSNGEVREFKDAPYDLLPTLYGAADLALAPSRYESFGYAVAESLACGTPVITTPTGASRLLLREYPLDFLVIHSASDVDKFKAAVSRVVREPESLRQVVVRTVRPQIQALMAPENWWPRFLEATGL